MAETYRGHYSDKINWKQKDFLDLVKVSYIGDYPGKTFRVREIFSGAAPRKPMSGRLLIEELGRNLVHYFDVESNFSGKGRVELKSVSEKRRES